MAFPYTQEESDSDFMDDEGEEQLFSDSDDEVCAKPRARNGGVKGSIASSKTPMATSTFLTTTLMFYGSQKANWRVL